MSKIQTIYEPSGKAREYSPLALNLYKGCDHGCNYCYVPDMKHALEASDKPWRFKELDTKAKSLGYVLREEGPSFLAGGGGALPRSTFKIEKPTISGAMTITRVMSLDEVETVLSAIRTARDLEA